MAEKGSKIRLGDLLTQAGLLEAKALREAMMIAKQQGLPVGRVLIMAQFISEPNLQAAVQAQSLLKDGLVEVEMVIEALKNCSSENKTLEESLQELGWKNSNVLSNKLGELIIEADFVSADALKQGLEQATSSGFPLGRVLVSMGFLSEQLLTAALNAQILIRDGKISRDQAIAGLKSARERQISIEESLSEQGLQMPSKETIRIGELLVNASIIDSEKLMQAVELGLVEEKPIGQVMVEKGHLNNEELNTTLMVQKCVAEGKVSKGLSGEVLKLMLTDGLTFEEAMKAIESVKAKPSKALPLYQFLQLSGIITAKDIEDALKLGSKDTELMGKMLLLTSAIDSHILTCAIELNEMMTQGSLKAEQAMLAMGLCQNRQCSVPQAFKSLGWSTDFPAGDSGLNTDPNADTIPPSSIPSTPLTSLSAPSQGQVDDLPPIPDHVSEAQRIMTSDFATPQANSQKATGDQPQTPSQQTTGDHPVLESQQKVDSQDLTSTTDVPPINVELTAGAESSEDEDSDRKRLSDLMP